MSTPDPSSEKTRFHRTTTMMITQILRQYNLPATIVEDLNFRSLCLHLNPLAELPSARNIEFINSSTGFSMDYAGSPCILCGKTLSNYYVVLTERMAAIHLTTAVITEKMPMQRAKRAMTNEKFYLCDHHIVSSHKAMFDALGGQICHDFKLIPDYAFLGGLAVFNNLMRMRNMYFDQEYRDLSEGEYRTLVKQWMVNDRHTVLPPKRLVRHGPASKRRLPIEAEIEREEESEPAENDEPLPTATAIVTPKSIAEALAEIDNSVEKVVKTEEPDMDYPQTSEQSSSSTSSPPPPSQPEVVKFLPTNLTVYTLKNGKKVVKAPKSISSAALAGSAGKLVTYRVAKRKVIRKPVEPEEERKPEFLL